MATTKKQGGEYITVTALENMTSGKFYVVGRVCGIAQTTVLSGAECVIDTLGVYSLDKEAAAGVTFAQSAEVYYNPTSGYCEMTDSTSNYLVGACETAAVNADTSVSVRLNGVSLTAITGDVSAKANKVVGAVLNDLAKLTATGDLADSGVLATNLPSMAAAGGVDEIIYTAAADRALAKSGLTVTATPQMAAVGGVGTLVQTAAANRAQSDSNIKVSEVPTVAAADIAGAADEIITSKAAGTTQQASGTLLTNVPTMLAVGGAGNFVQTAAADKALSNSGVPIANVALLATTPQMAAVGGAGNLIQTAAADRAQSDSGIPVANVALLATTPQMAAVGGAGNLLQTAAADRAVSDAGIPVANVALLATTPQMAAAGGVGTLVMTAAADRAQSDSTVVAANVPQQAAAAAAAGRIPVSGGADRSLASSTQSLGTEPTGTGDAVTVMACPCVLQVDLNGPAASYNVFAADAPFAIRIIGFETLCSAAVGGGTARLNDAAGGGGNNITDAVAMAVLDTIGRAATIDYSNRDIALGGSLSINKNAGADSGMAYIHYVRIP